MTREGYQDGQRDPQGGSGDVGIAGRLQARDRDLHPGRGLELDERPHQVQRQGDLAQGRSLVRLLFCFAHGEWKG